MRRSAWAAWAAGALVEVSNGRRSYPALRLPGDFYDPHGNGPKITPHLEIPAKVFEQADGEVPARLAEAGNGLLFPYWLYEEVVAVRRNLLRTEPGPIGEFCDTIDVRRDHIRDALVALGRFAEPHWSTIAEAIVSGDERIASDACDDFTADEVTSWIPAVGDYRIEVRFDNELRERNGTYVARRIGVWQICGTNRDGTDFSFGVITPRLTVNSLFSDPLFTPEREGPAAALVRSLILRRIINSHLGAGKLIRHRIRDPVRNEEGPVPDVGGHLRAVPAQAGQKLPEASVRAAMAFVAAYPDANSAWSAIERWAERGYLVTVTRDSFIAAHHRASRALRRAEEPRRGDVDTVLPLAWDDRAGHTQVVRVTWTRSTDRT